MLTSSVGKMPGHRKNPGFTLVELLVVLAMIALLVALARPMYGAAVPGARVRADVLGLATSLRQSRNRAISSGKTVVVLFDTAGTRFSIGHVVENLSKSTQLKATQRGTAGPEDAIVRLEFYPDGSSTGASIELSNATVAYQLDVDWLTGRIRVAKRDSDAS